MFPDMGWTWTPESATGMVVSVRFEDLKILGFMTKTTNKIPEDVRPWKIERVETYTYTFEIFEADRRLGRATSHVKDARLTILLAEALEGLWI